MHLHQNVSRNKFNITLIKPLKKVNREFKKKIYICLPGYEKHINCYTKNDNGDRGIERV